MKLKSGFITHMNTDEQIMVCTNEQGFHGMVRSNRSAAAIIDLLKKETTREQMLKDMKKRYDADESVLLADIDMVIKNLRKIGALEE